MSGCETQRGLAAPAGRSGDERGIALILTLILLIGLAAMSAGAILMTGTESQLRTYTRAQMNLRYLAEQAAEMGLSRVNRDESALPDTGYNVLEYQIPAEDAAGNPVPGVKLNVYSARTGSATGNTGNFASVVGVAEGYGGRSIVRLEVTEESFARFAYFTDVWLNYLVFGLGSEYFGPVHSNEEIRIHSTGATFHGEVTAVDDIRGRGHGRFHDGFEEHVEQIPLPDAADFSRLSALADAGDTHFTAPSSAPPFSDVEMRIEFVAIDVDGDGDRVDEEEGFFRIYRSWNSDWLGAYGDGGMPGPWSENCGDWHDHPVTGDPTFISAANHRRLYDDAEDVAEDWADELGGDDDLEDALEDALEDWEHHWPLRHGLGGNSWSNVYRRAVSRDGSRCYLGGDPRLTPTNGLFDPWNGGGHDSGWLRRADFAPAATIPASIAGRSDAEFLFPLHTDYNPDFRGVIFFDGLVGISGVLNGRVTIASNNSVVLLDDFTYSVPANAERCNDIAGFVTTRSFAVAYNNINAPRRYPGVGGGWRTYDDTGSEFIDGIILGTNPGFQVESYAAGPTNGESCLGVANGRGCLFITGGIIERETGITGVTDGRGYIERYAYDSNARFCPPPHFPTTGRYAKNRYFQVGSDAFENIGQFFDDLR